ncbi:MAG: ABC transporter permease [Clostridia bacterium]|nr:ABC transporter permease [Clostridia bacterium]
MKLFRKLFNRTDTILIRNNIFELWFNRRSRFYIIFIPVAIAILIPVLFLLIALLTSVGADVDAFHSLLPESMRNYNAEQTIYYLSTNLLLPMLFPIIPILVSTVTTGTCLIDEKEQKTIGSLFVTPVDPWQTLRSKFYTAQLITLAATLLSSFSFLIIASVGNLILSTAFVLDGIWAVTIFLFSPALSIFSSLLVIVFQKQYRTSRDAYRSAAYLIFPLLLVYSLQFLALYRIGWLTLAIVSLLLLLTGFILLFVQKNHFRPEKI